jgi:hypothetical protein
VCSEDEKAKIFQQMQRCVETFRYLTDRLKGTDEGLPTPVGVLQSTSSVVNDMEQQFHDERVVDNEVVNKNVKAKKPRSNTDSMSSEELNNYLERHITDEHCYKELMSTPVDYVENDLEGIARQLKHTNERVDGSILQVYYILGSQLNNGKARFDERKLNEGVTETWSEWVKRNVGLSTSHCNKIRLVADLLTKYPRLQNLKGISFTRLYNLRKNIKELFTNEDIAKQWSEKMIYRDELCVLCCTHPREPSAFIPCGHGLDYCNSCMVETMKNRETDVEVVLDDGQIESQTMKITGKKCPECRKRINRIQVLIT